MYPYGLVGLFGIFLTPPLLVVVAAAAKQSSWLRAIAWFEALYLLPVLLGLSKILAQPPCIRAHGAQQDLPRLDPLDPQRAVPCGSRASRSRISSSLDASTMCRTWIPSASGPPRRMKPVVDEPVHEGGVRGPPVLLAQAA